MTTAKQEHNWSKYFSVFTELNRSRRTRIAVFEGEPGEMIDYWLEDGLPLVGIDIDPNADHEGPTIEIMLGTPNGEHLTHVTENARSAKINLSWSGRADGLEIDTRDGKTTVLQFEKNN